MRDVQVDLQAIAPGLFESSYQRCLAYELRQHGLSFRTEVPIPIRYKGVALDCGYRADLIVNDELLVELKSVQVLLPVHHAQMITYLKLAGLHEGLLINFNAPRLVDGLKSFLVSGDRLS